jgi:hypothetical protein
VFNTAERLALAGYLAWYSGLIAGPVSWICVSAPAGATLGAVEVAPSVQVRSG